DRPALDELPAKALHAQPLRVAVPTVAARALTLLVRHPETPEKQEERRRPRGRMAALVQSRSSPVLDLDAVDPQGRVVLTMTLGPPVVLALLELEDPNLAVTALIEHGGGHGSAGDLRRADLQVVAAAHEQDVFQGDRLAGGLVQAFHVDGVALGHPVL